jgi:tryptophanyl-tRNA synthetase
MQGNKPRLMTGDTPTGRLHLGHWIGTLANRVELQKSYECFFLIANIHAFTTQSENPKQIHQNTLDVVLDNLAAGIDPNLSHIFIQSEIPAISELTYFFSMLISYPRVLRNPTIKEEINTKKLGRNYSFGFLLYSVGQVADILAFRPEIVPVGEDQLPHLEMCRETARRFNQLYCGVDSHTEDKDYVQAGGLFPIIEAKLGKVERLVGIGPPNEQGQLLKMSKSLNNAILLSDTADEIAKKVMAMYTDPKRLRPTDKGTIENNPLWIFHDAFNEDKTWINEAKLRYQAGTIGDVECKKKLIEVLVALIEPMRLKRKQLEKDLNYVYKILQEGCDAANHIANQTLKLAKEAMHQLFF